MASNKRLYTIIAVVVLVVVITVAVALAVGLNKQDKTTADSLKGYYDNGAVSTDAEACSKIGRDVLKDGGHAVDAAIASLICTGVVNCHSTGIGGGGFMNVYDRTTKTSKIFDYRETGPASLTADAYDENPDFKKVGGLAVGVPGELRGLKKAHEMYGKLEWKRLIQPSVDLARKGSRVNKHLAFYIGKSKKYFLADEGLRELICYDQQCDRMKKRGEFIKNEKYAATLEEVGKNYDAINNGKLSAQFISDVKARNGTMTLDDLKNYTVLVKEPLAVRIEDLKLNLYTTPLPGGGTVLAHIINMIKGYSFNKKDESTTEKKILTYHRLTEIFKFSYAKRPYLGDPDTVDVDKKTSFNKKVEEIQNATKAEQLRQLINDSSTQKPSFYDPFFVAVDTDGTTHVSLIDKDGNAVAATDTINYAFGAKFRSMKSGIIYNNENADFFTKSAYSSFNTTESPPPFNQPGPGRRPLSSTCPTIITDDNGDVVMVVGASGGTRITLSTAWVILKKLYMGYELHDAVEDARVQHAFSPRYIRNEIGVPLQEDIVEGLRTKNHVIKASSSNAIVQGIFVDRKNNNRIYAKSDPRKEGKAAGY